MDTLSFSTAFTGGMAMVLFLVYLAWGMVGIVAQVLIDLIKRKPESTTSPQTFSLAYYWNDNKYRLLVAIVLMPICILLYSELMGTDLSRLEAFSIGFASDMIADILKRKTQK